jgi:hypothetical protein
MKKNISFSLSFALCLVLAGVLNVGAAECAAGMQGDADQNDVLTCSEAKNLAAERFSALDTNKDKRLNMDEMETGMTGIHKTMNTNGDGTVDVREYVSYWCGVAPSNLKAAARGNKQPQFSKMDTNRDGTVSSGECQVLWTVRFRDADESRDGKLTSREYVQSIILWFADMDPNRDSSVTLSEWNKYWIGSCRTAKK